MARIAKRPGKSRPLPTQSSVFKVLNTSPNVIDAGDGIHHSAISSQTVEVIRHLPDGVPAHRRHPSPCRLALCQPAPHPAPDRHSPAPADDGLHLCDVENCLVQISVHFLYSFVMYWHSYTGVKTSFIAALSAASWVGSCYGPCASVESNVRASFCFPLLYLLCSVSRHESAQHFSRVLRSCRRRRRRRCTRSPWPT